MGENVSTDETLLHKVAKWIGGCTAVLLALVGLKAAFDQLIPSKQEGNSIESNASVAATNAAEVAAARAPSTNEMSNSVAPQPPAPTRAHVPELLPTKYRKPNGFLEKQSDGWLETDETTGMAIRWSEEERRNGYTILWDNGRQMYLRIPNEGGQVQWSYPNPIVWTDLYYVQPD